MAHKPGSHPKSRKKKNNGGGGRIVYKKNKKTSNTPAAPAAALPSTGETSEVFAMRKPVSQQNTTKTETTFATVAVVAEPTDSHANLTVHEDEEVELAEEGFESEDSDFEFRSTPAPKNTALRIGKKYVTVTPPQTLTVTDVHPFGKTATVTIEAINGTRWEKTFTLDKGRLPLRVVPAHQATLEHVQDHLQYTYANLHVETFTLTLTPENPLKTLSNGSPEIVVTPHLHPNSEDFTPWEIHTLGKWLIKKLARYGYAYPIRITPPTRNQKPATETEPNPTPERQTEEPS